MNYQDYLTINSFSIFWRAIYMIIGLLI